MTRGQKRRYRPRLYLLPLAVLMLVGLMTFPVIAAEGGTSTAAIAQGFTSEGDLVPGSLVSLADSTKSGIVRSAARDTADRLIGVVSDKPLIELSGTESQAQVVISGTVLALVSNINGDIKYGDKITASPINGVGMKATASGTIVGAAAQDFLTAQRVSERSVEDLSGNNKSVKIGLLPVQINVSYYQAPDENKTVLPAFLQQFVNSIAGKPVGVIRTLLSLILLITGFGGVGVLLYSSVRSSIISIGRNPLSAPAVHRSLFEVGAMGIGVLMVMLIAVYLVLVI